MNLRSPAPGSRVLIAIATGFLESSWAFGTSHGPAIGRLLEAQCPENQSVYAPKQKRDDSAATGDCVLAFADVGEGEGSVAIMHMDKSDVRLRVLRKKDTYSNVHFVLTNSASTLNVVMDVKRDCQKDVEGCDFSGTLTVESPEGRSKIRVVYYRGG